MLTTLSAIAMTSAANTGALTNLSVMSRGLVRAAGRLTDRDYRSVAIEAMAGFAAPALMTDHAASDLMNDAADAALSLASGVLTGSEDAARLLRESDLLATSPFGG